MTTMTLSNSLELMLDDAFRALLAADPRTAFARLGLALPQGAVGAATLPSKDAVRQVASGPVEDDAGSRAPAMFLFMK